MSSSFAMRANRRVAELLRPGNEEELERYRFQGSLNKVYRVPLDDESTFVVVKVLPRRGPDIRRLVRRRLRALLYGDREISLGRSRARLEVERYREWQEAGLPVPRLIETPLRDVRIIEGLPYPTFYSLLCEIPLEVEQRLELVCTVTRRLAEQHALARKHGRKSLVHRDPGPWNILVDRDTDRVWWFDLEHAADYPGATLEDLCVRGLRVFTLGVLDHLESQFDLVMRTVVEAYEPKATLELLAANLERSAESPLMRMANRVGVGRAKATRQRRVARALRQLLHRPT